MERKYRVLAKIFTVEKSDDNGDGDGDSDDGGDGDGDDDGDGDGDDDGVILSSTFSYFAST